MAAALPLCYHGVISKKQTEDILGKINKDGAYLIRESETIKGAMCLCVYKEKLVYTYRLLQTHSGHYTLLTAENVEEKVFKTLDALIQHYKKRNQGMAIHLCYSVERERAKLIHPKKYHREEAHNGNMHGSRRVLPPIPSVTGQEARHTLDSLPVHRRAHSHSNAPDSSDYVKVLPSSDYVKVLPSSDYVKVLPSSQS